MSHLDFGREGENLACTHLLAKGYQILERNYRHGRAEIDIIAKKGVITVFVEVKTRSGTGFGYPEQDVTKSKEQLVMGAAEHYMDEHPEINLVRYDIISIVKQNGKTEIMHIEDAFY